MIDLDEKITVTRRQLAAMVTLGELSYFARHEDKLRFLPRFISDLPTHPRLQPGDPEEDHLHATIDQVLKSTE